MHPLVIAVCLLVFLGYLGWLLKVQLSLVNSAERENQLKASQPVPDRGSMAYCPEKWDIFAIKVIQAHYFFDERFSVNTLPISWMSQLPIKEESRFLADKIKEVTPFHALLFPIDEVFIQVALVYEDSIYVSTGNMCYLFEQTRLPFETVFCELIRQKCPVHLFENVSLKIAHDIQNPVTYTIKKHKSTKLNDMTEKGINEFMSPLGLRVDHFLTLQFLIEPADDE